MSSQPTSAIRSQIFREYIGAHDQQIELTNVPNLRKERFHFMLAFATDYDSKGKNHNGDFKPNWEASITPEMISKYKAKFNNAKVLLSIGWYDASRPFTEKDKSKWISNAISTLTGIIKKLHLDGLDINYWEIHSKEPAIFAECVGKVITQLKRDDIIHIVSISPTAMLNVYYSKLYADYKDQIDFVNYQFYTEPVKHDYETMFKEAIARVQKNYPKANIIAGYSTDKRDYWGNIKPDVFFKVYKQMSHQLGGIFVWCADTSPADFPFEKEAQQILSK